MSEGIESARADESDALLTQAERAFETGNFAKVHELGKRLALSADPAVADAGRALVRRVSIDPLAVAFFLACVVFFAMVVERYVL